MKKNKPSKKKVKPENPELSKINELIKREGGILSKPYIEKISRIEKPFKSLADKTNPFWVDDDPRASTLSDLVNKLYDFSLLCADLMVWEFGLKGEKEAVGTIKREMKEMQALLEKLRPEEAKPRKERRERLKRKKTSALRVFRKAPDKLIRLVDETIRPQLRKYYIPPYSRDTKGKKSKRDAIKAFWEESFKPPYNKFPKRIYINDDTETNIILSVVAYHSSCRYRALLDIYYQAKKQT